MTRVSILVVLLLLSPVALAQTSASYKLQESVFNAGGDPAQGSVLASASYRLKLDSIGEGIVWVGLSSASYHADGSFVSAYPPPGEVQGQLFTGKQTMTWSPERSVGRYEVYRDPVSAIRTGGTGACFASGLAAELVTDASVPAAGQGYFYLVTARNRLGEEGTKGFRTSGAERPNPAPCP